LEAQAGPGGGGAALADTAMDRYNQRNLSVARGLLRAREISRMINVTPAAASKISELLVEENKENAGLRVFVQGGGCSGFQYGLMIDEGEGDQTTDAVIETNGVKLLVDPISARYLAGAEVDFVDNITGGGFTIKNPNAKSTCGCGSSFSV
jgi:iron-sulfur cluster insertion protein